MKIQLLETEFMAAERPLEIKELFRAENVLVVDPKNGNPIDVGDQVLLEGKKEDFLKWLTRLPLVCVNFGSMQLEQFSILRKKADIEKAIVIFSESKNFA